MAHAQAMRAEYDALVDDDLILACVDDFCRLTVRHRVKRVAGGGVGGAYGDNAAGAGSAAYAALRQAGGGGAGAERFWVLSICKVFCPRICTSGVVPQSGLPQHRDQARVIKFSSASGARVYVACDVQSSSRRRGGARARAICQRAKAAS